MKTNGTFAQTLLLVLMVTMADATPQADTSNTGRHEREKRSDDVSATEVIVQQLSQKVSELTAEMAALKATQAKGNTQVAFQARPSQDPFNVIVGKPVIFDVIITNIGNGYDHMSGVFTAPVSDVYVFHLTCMDRHDVNNAFAINLIANGATVAVCWSEDNHMSSSSSTQAAVHLLAGQKAWGTSVYTEDARGAFYSTFGGYLVTPDVA